LDEGRRKKEEGRRSFLDGDTGPQLKTDDPENSGDKRGFLTTK
jgi:hypothetical protein